MPSFIGPTGFNECLLSARHWVKDWEAEVPWSCSEGLDESNVSTAVEGTQSVVGAGRASGAGTGQTPAHLTVLTNWWG